MRFRNKDWLEARWITAEIELEPKSSDLPNYSFEKTVKADI
jgi:hypothetical protein